MPAARLLLDFKQLAAACREDPQIAHEWKNCESYHDLLRLFFAVKKSINPKFSFALLAKRSGFAARGFMKDVMDGKKRLTYSSLSKVIKGLDLDSDAEEFLRLMVASKESDVHFADFSPQKISSLIQKHRRKLNLLLASDSPQDVPSPFRNFAAPRIFSALGTIDHGATLKDIKLRTSFQMPEIKAALQHLLHIGMIEHRRQDDRYRVVQQDIYVREEEAKSAFRDYYLEVMRGKIKQMNDLSFDDPGKLFWLSHVSVRSKDLPKIKQDLRELLARYIERVEDPNGDHIADLLLSFT